MLGEIQLRAGRSCSDFLTRLGLGGWFLRYLMLCAACAVWGSSAVYADSVKSVHVLSAGVEVATEEGSLTIEPWSDSIVHVRFGPAGYTGNYNPAVIARPARVAFAVRQKRDAYVISAGRVRVRIAKASALLSFADATGSTLLEEAQRTLGKGTIAAFSTRAIIYGLGQHQTGRLDYSGTTVHLQQTNGDVGVPMLLSPSGFGILWNNASVMDVDVAKPDEPFPLMVRNEAGAGIDYHFILGPEADDVIAGYRWLTGDAPLMPRWSWGFWQSREHYETQEQVLGVARTYRAMGVPLDAVVQDWQYWRSGEWAHISSTPRASRTPQA